MKEMKYFTFLFAATFVILGCTETVEIEKLIFDTVYVDKPRTSLVQTIHVDTVYKELLRVDTVEVTVVVHDTIVNETIVHDTVFQIKTDSVFIERVVEKVVNHYDTIVQIQTINHTDTIYLDKIVTIHDTVTVTEYEHEVVYLSVQYIYLFPGQSTFYIPDPFMPHYLSFIAEANARNKTLPGGDVVLEQVDPSQLAGENWTSDSFEVSGFQWVIRISSDLTVEESKSAIFRELGRMQLKKRYSNDVNKIMCPLWSVTREITFNDLNELFR